jgi:hypothetical protein
MTPSLTLSNVLLFVFDAQKALLSEFSNTYAHKCIIAYPSNLGSLLIERQNSFISTLNLICAFERCSGRHRQIDWKLIYAKLKKKPAEVFSLFYFFISSHAIFGLISISKI